MTIYYFCEMDILQTGTALKQNTLHLVEHAMLKFIRKRDSFLLTNNCAAV